MKYSPLKQILKVLSVSVLVSAGILIQGCKDTHKSSKSSSQQAKPADARALNKMTPAQQDAALESELEHKADNAKTTQRVDQLVDEENAIQEATQGTGPLYSPQNGNILQNWTNHQDNLASPLNHNY
ncbi:hypothetical protein [Helicobacter suis]|uniref:hypothetical protein n=1 Tax=Helicobacter suis TaxID=104628 RepID=UPI0013D828DE|nr:hypothetical protein [Helicobacter suis]